VTQKVAPVVLEMLDAQEPWKFNLFLFVTFYYCPRGSDGLYCSRRSFFLSVTTITHEPLHSAWWHFARTCTSTTSRTLLNFKVIGQRSASHGFLVFFCVHDAAATRGQYLALSKAWWSCYLYVRVAVFTVRQKGLFLCCVSTSELRFVVSLLG